MDVNSHSKQLLFTTVKFTAQLAGGVESYGTGFIFDVSREPGRTRPFIVTNKHVVDGAQKLSIRLVGRSPDADQPQLGVAYDFNVDYASIPFVGHPDPAVDIAAVPLLPIIQGYESKVFYRSITQDFLPTADEAKNLDALEEVTFIGYPSGWADGAHHTPIIRRGITATPMGLNFDGRPFFLVDGSVFGGSSGSPVFLLNEGSYTNGKGGLVVGSRLKLVGIIAQTMVHNSVLPVDVSTQPHVKLAKEMNLGVAINWWAIAETIEELDKFFGVPSPEHRLLAGVAKPE